MRAGLTSDRSERSAFSRHGATELPERVAPRIVRIYTLRGFESVLAGSVQVSTGTKTSLSFQDGPVFTRVHRREGPAAPRGSDAGSSRENSYTPSPGARPLRPTGPTGSARLRTPNRRGELPASHPRSYHLVAESGDRSCFERGGLGCGRSQLRVTVPYQPDRVGQRPPLRRVPAQPQSRAKRKA